LITPDYSKAYLRHLVHCQEILGAMIASLHNIKFYLWLMNEARTKIKEGNFMSWKNTMVQQMNRKI